MLAPHCTLQWSSASKVCCTARCAGSWLLTALFCLLLVTRVHDYQIRRARGGTQRHTACKLSSSLRANQPDGSVCSEAPGPLRGRPDDRGCIRMRPPAPLRLCDGEPSPFCMVLPEEVITSSSVMSWLLWMRHCCFGLGARCRPRRRLILVCSYLPQSVWLLWSTRMWVWCHG